MSAKVTRRFPRTTLILAVAGPLACAQAPSSLGIRPNLTVSLLQDTVVFVRTDKGAGFAATAVIRNDGDGPVFWPSTCGESAQRFIDGIWTTVWTPVCLSGSGGFQRLAPRDSLVLRVNVSGFTDPQFAPKLDPRFQPGIYRLAFQGVATKAPNPSGNPSVGEERVSPAFVARDTTTR
jgi:hypothetical protein